MVKWNEDTWRIKKTKRIKQYPISDWHKIVGHNQDEFVMCPEGMIEAIKSIRYQKREPERHGTSQFYQEFLKSKCGDKAWNVACNKYPNYNSIETETEKAVKYILKQMKKYYEKKYGKGTWYVGLEDRLHDDVQEGLI